MRIVTIEPPVFTCDAVLSEACFSLRTVQGGPDAVLELVARGIVRSDFRVTAEIHTARALMTKLKDVPMSPADACLVRTTELEPHSTVLTSDSDFKPYRRNRRQLVPTISPSTGGG